jgi:uncharacterized cupin superfamily protein
MTFATNVWAELDDMGDGVSGTRLHHGTKELVLVLRGTLTVRVPDEEHELREGEVLAFARGLDGAHGMLNRSDAPVRYLMVAEHWSLDIIEYPDEGTLCTIAFTPSTAGEPLFRFFRLDDSFERDAEE